MRSKNIWDFSHVSGKIKLLTKNGITYTGYVITVEDGTELETTEDFIVIRCDDNVLRVFEQGEIRALSTDD